MEEVFIMVDLTESMVSSVFKLLETCAVAAPPKLLEPPRLFAVVKGSGTVIVSRLKVFPYYDYHTQRNKDRANK